MQKTTQSLPIPRICHTIYSDEVDPGRELATRHSRKVEVLYWSILEFGMPALTDDDMYFTTTILRSELREEVRMPHLARKASVSMCACACD